MNTPNLDSFVAIPISNNLYLELSKRYRNGVSSVIEHISWDFLDRTAEDFESTIQNSDGIYWESLLLPDGTEIRTKYFNQYKTAVVKNQDLIWEGNKYPSMSQLASAMRGNTSNNAWKVLEIKRPSDAKWFPAMQLRR